MKRIITLLISVVMIFALCIPAFAAEAPKEEEKVFYPIEGSWKLNTVFNLVDGQEPVEMKEEEAQSLYGTGINIFTFDEDGYAHNMLFAGPDTFDTAAQWKTTKPNVYLYTEENGIEITFTYEAEKDVLHRYFEIPDEDATYKKLDFVYARAVVGSWKLDQVLEIHEGDAPVEMKKEENQSLYAEAENVLTFELEGKVKELVKGGGDEITEEGTWEMPEPDKYVYTIDTLETEMEYFRVDDTLFRNVKAEEGQPYFRFIYARAEEPKEEETPQAAETPQPAAAQEPASPEEEDELIADGQIFTGNKIYNMVKSTTGEYVVLSELNQGGWADEETGEIFHWETPQYGEPKAMWGDRDTVLWIDTVYNQVHSNDDELIADGQIFTGNKIYYMVDVSTGRYVVLSELNQGGWADEETGEIFHWDIPQYGEPKTMWGDRDTVLMIDTVYNELYNNDDEYYYDDDELIADGQIFSGNKIYYMVNTSTGRYVVLSELNQGGWVDDETGEIFHWETPQYGEPKTMWGDWGTVLMIDYVYDALYNNDDDFDGGYAGINYYDDEDYDGGYAGSNYYDDDYYSEDWD